MIYLKEHLHKKTASFTTGQLDKLFALWSLFVEARKAMTSGGALMRKATSACDMLEEWKALAKNDSERLQLQHALGNLEIHLVAIILDRKARQHA